MSADNLIGLWKEVRAGLIREVERIPADQFSFKATEETRSVSELVQHIIETQKCLVGETCRADTNLRRQSLAEHMKEYGAVRDVTSKAGLLELLQTSVVSPKYAAVCQVRIVYDPRSDTNEHESNPC